MDRACYQTDVRMPFDDMPPFSSLTQGSHSAPRLVGSPSAPEASGLRASLKSQVTDALSTLREVVLMPRDLGPVVPRELEHEDDVVVLVHGFFASAGVWRPMKRTLVDKTGAKVASFTHAPGAGIE